MIVVIQCAGRKHPGAGKLSAPDGRKVTFVANPRLCGDNHTYVRPDDLMDDSGITWREKLIKYNEHPGNNPDGLCQAYQLYADPVYSDLASKFMVSNVFILSAGWGLVRADYLLPYYDITFSQSASFGNRRNYRRDAYEDFNMLPDSYGKDVCFLGGKDYVPLFCDLTSNYSGKRVVYYNSDTKSVAEGCEVIRFESNRRTNWHYECAKVLIGEQGLDDCR